MRFQFWSQSLSRANEIGYRQTDQLAGEQKQGNRNVENVALYYQ